LNKPLVSIITTCLNNADTIEDTIQSVLNQSYSNIEYIIVDGASNDSTLDIINKYKTNIKHIISEKDNGIYEALNKGLNISTGEIIGILHADDFFSSNQVIEKIVDTFLKKDIDATYADLDYIDRDDTTKIKRHWVSGKYDKCKFLKGWMPPHPTVFIKKSIYSKFGQFNTNFKQSADYELLLRLMYKHGIKVVYIPSVLVKMRVGGKSNKNILNRLKANREDKLAWKLNGLKASTFTHILKPLSKLGQFF